ncbi:hypothetical protein AVEN_172143-1 [Araneus ventricosus]|uniref:Uncharacterized protein n=1 Tax=Araneus ventricosus TaxID=182803 RepID=A0A4Y2K2Z8_ARAVE|nr:hypothetical protein AVEN_172143-1 [Araneus ventricosus]
MIELDPESPVSKVVYKDDYEVVRKYELDKLVDQTIMPHSVKCFADIKEYSSSEEFVVKTLGDGVSYPKQLMNAAMAYPKTVLFVWYDAKIVTSSFNLERIIFSKILPMLLRRLMGR